MDDHELCADFPQKFQTSMPRLTEADMQSMLWILQHMRKSEEGHLPSDSMTNFSMELPLAPTECVFSVKEEPFGYIPKKRGRKPRANSCSLCGLYFPYKCQLISHLQRDHKIARSKSLLYKRILQGKKVIEEVKRAADEENERAEAALPPASS